MVQTRLKQLREEAVLTVHELAEASGVSDDTISKIENGQRVARPSTLRKLARALEVSPQELRRPVKAEERVLAGGKAEASDTGLREAAREFGGDVSVGETLVSFPYTQETASEAFAKAVRFMRGVRVRVGDLLDDARLVLTDDGEKVRISVEPLKEKSESWDAVARAVGIYAEEVSPGANLVPPFSEEPPVEEYDAERNRV